MSRVRILNLPSDCTEEQLRQHILRSAPPSAPSLEITDCIIKRCPAGTGHRGDHRGRPGGIRMAFVGFRTAAAGKFIVQYLNNSYFRSAKMRVEMAKGLNEVGVTVNMLKKMGETNANRKRPRESPVGGYTDDATAGQDGARATPFSSSATSATVRPRGGGTDAHVETDDGARPLGGVDNALVAQRKKEGKDQFVAGRTTATGGPTWASEVLIPTGGGEVAKSAPGMPTHPCVACAIKADDGFMEAADTSESELDAFLRQQALGAVSDADFLAMLKGRNVPAEPTSDQGEMPGTNAHASEHAEGVSDSLDVHHRQSTPILSPRAGQVDEEAHMRQEDIARESRRIRLGNLPYIATEADVKQFASSLVGPVEEVHIPLTKDTKQSKGAAFVRFVMPDDAVRALSLCNGAIHMGRLLRVSAAEDDPHSRKVLEREARQASGAAGGGVAGASIYKTKKEIDRRHPQPQGNGMTWNTLYMNSHAAVEAVAQRLGVTTQDVVGVEAKGAAVRAAIAEAYLTSEVQQVLSDEGIAFETLEGAGQNLLKARSNTTILVKNLQLKHPDEAAELSKMFVRYGALETTAFPSAGTFALFRYTHPQDARIAFTRLSYKLFRNSPLFLEWAPVGAIVEEGAETGGEPVGKAVDGGASGSDTEETAESRRLAAAAKTAMYTLFITNLAFNATEEDFYAFLIDCCPRLAKAPERCIVRLAYQKDHGRAFLTVADQSTMVYCQAKMHGKPFAGRVLSCVPSKQTAQQQIDARHNRDTIATDGTRPAAEEDEDVLHKATAVISKHGRDRREHGAHPGVPPGADPLKLIVKNLPFEATEKDVRELFSAFSEVRSVRVPRKGHTFSSHRENNHRGFAFVEFLSEAEAKRAMDSLKATHLYGRHLVLQYAKLDVI